MSKLFCLVLLSLITFVVDLHAQVPRTLSYQGTIIKDGQPVTGPHDLSFSIYESMAGGSALHTELHPGVIIDNGYFNVLLGSLSSLPVSLAFDKPYYLGIRIDGGSELTPRTAITAAAYALYSARAAEAQSLSATATGVVTSINNQSGALTFEGGGTTTVSANGNTITISSTGGGGATGIQGVQSVNASLAITNGSGPIANLAINDNAVKTSNLFDAAVTSAKLANESVSTAKLADASVNSAKLVDGSVTNVDLADASVTSAKLAPDAVTDPAIANDAVNSAKLLDGSVATPDLADGSVTTPKLADGAVSSAKILDATIGTADLASLAVTDAKIGSGAALSGRVLTANGAGAATWAVPSITLPFAATTNTGAPAFDIQTTASTGGAGSFKIANAANTTSAFVLGTTGTGSGLTVQLSNSSNGSRGIDVTHAGVGPGVFATSAGGNAVWGITSSIAAAGVIGDNTYGEAVVGRNRGGNGVGAVVGRNDSSGYGVRGFNTKAGIGVLGQAGISAGTGVGGRFENVSASNTNTALEAATNGNGSALWARNSSSTASAPAVKLHVHPSSSSALLLGSTNNGSTITNVVRIDKTGKGFFNGGTQNSGADVAEAFAVVGDIGSYEPGDVLVIAAGHSRTVQRSSTPYSTAVLGVHATKPGVLLTERDVDTDMSDLVPMGVVGVLHTKVTNEGGPINAGDLLVTSSTEGHAMKADPAKLGFGMVLGKALEPFHGASGVIQVFVNVK